MPGHAKQEMLKKQARFSACALLTGHPDCPEDTGSESGDADYQFTEASSSEDYRYESGVGSGQEEKGEGAPRRDGQCRNMYKGS